IKLSDEPSDKLGIDRELLPLIRLDDALSNRLLDRLIQRQKRQLSVAIHEFSRDRAGQGRAGVLRKDVRVLLNKPVLSQSLKHGAKIADRDVLFKEVFQHLEHSSHRKNSGYELINDLWRRLLEMI